MSKESQYIILSPQLKVIGVTDINGATPFSADLITRQIADTDNTTDDVATGVENFNTNNDPNANSKNWNHTGEITVAEGYPDSYKVAANNYLMYWDESAQHYYVMYISQETDAGTDASGRHVNTYQLENVLITNMNDYIPLKQTLKDADAETAFIKLFTDSNWKLDFQAKSALLSTTTFDGKTNAMSYLQAMLQAYDVEMDAYAELSSNGDIKDLVVQIVDKLGTDVHHWVADYGNNNVLGITRTTVYSNVVTKLHVLNSNGNSIADVNNGKDYLVNDEANRKYNPNWKNGTYLEGTVTFPTVLNHSALKSLGQRQLDLFSHPRTSYEVTPSANFKPGLGDNIRGTDRKMVPELVIDARAISVTTSKADYTQDLVQFGEFVTLHPTTPSYIQNVLNKLTDDVNKAKSDAASIRVNMLTPDGNDFSNTGQQKRVIIQAFEGKTNITSHFLPEAFQFEKLQNGVVDETWHAPSVTNDFRVIRQHENLKIAANHAEKIIELKRYTDFEGGLSTGIQFFVPLSNGDYVISSNRLDEDIDTSFFLLDKSGALKSSMIVTKGGHGSTFGIEEEKDGNFNVWTLIRNGNDSWAACIPWQKNKRVDYKSKVVKKYCHHNRYMRVGLSSDSKYVVIGYAAGKGTIYVCNINDVKNNKFSPLYQVQQADFGIDVSLTFQAQVLDFPYLYVDYGDYAMKEKYRKIYCINVETQELVTEHRYGFYSRGMGNFDPVKEPEGIYVSTENGKKYLYQAFNTTKDASCPIFKMPIAINGVGKIQEANLNGYLLNVTDTFDGKLRSWLETNYLSEESELSIDENRATLINQYKHPSSTFSFGDYACQYVKQLPDGSWLTSHHYQKDDLKDGHKTDTMYIHWDANWQYIDNMLVYWGGHGSSFGVDYITDINRPWIWSMVEDWNTASGKPAYYIAHFPYQGGKKIKWTELDSDYLEQYCEFDDYISVNYDSFNKLVGVRHSNGHYDVLDVSDVTNNTYKPIYTVKFSDIGFDSKKQTFQSSELDFPYVYWQSGNIDMSDRREVYCLNVITDAQVFDYIYEFSGIKPLDVRKEPEGISVLKNDDGSKSLLVSFNFDNDAQNGHTEGFYTIPIKYRKEVET